MFDKSNNLYIGFSHCKLFHELVILTCVNSLIQNYQI